MNDKLMDSFFFTGNESRIYSDNEGINPSPNEEDNFFTRPTIDYAKGKSFRFVGEWATGVHYFDDDYYQDWITYKDALLICKQNHFSDNPPELIYENKVPIGCKSENWDFVISYKDFTGKIEDILLELNNKADKTSIPSFKVTNDILIIKTK